MEAGQKLIGEQIEPFLPHRGLNRLVDSIEFFQDGEKLMGRSRLTIRDGSPDGRDIFLETTEAGRTYSPYVLVEHVALTSSVQISPHRKDGDIAYFSTITNFKGGARLPADREIVAVIEPLGRRGPFHRSSCVATVPSLGESGEVRAELMAAIVPAGVETGSGGDKKTLPAPTIVDLRPVEKSVFAYKNERFLFLDEETALDRENRALTGRYRYPEDHPFVHGHFPGNPVMMGVTQWAGLLDSAVWLCHRLDMGAGLFRADGEILREDGTLVTEVKGIVFERNDPAHAPKLLKTKRIGFRDMVGTGETIYYSVRVSPM